MTISQESFISLLQGVKQYQIPIYQRNYAWKTDSCKRLLDDIIKAGTPDNPNHYIGSIIIKKEETGIAGVDIYNVIDGQQRLTTISLLLLALKNNLSDNPSRGVQDTTVAIIGSIKNNYLINDALINTSLFTKILPKIGDNREEYENLLHEVVGNGSISKNYLFFVNELKKRKYNPELVFNGINNSQLALVKLENNDNPQLLFEAVNDTGVDLTQVDLVRNWLFMGLESAEQERLYRTYWKPMEEDLDKDIDRFLSYYTELKTVSTVGNKYYKSFKKAFILNSGSHKKIESLLCEIKGYADIYKQLLNDTIDDAKIKEVLKNIKYTGKAIFTPFILKLLNSWKENVFCLDEVIDALKYLEAYIVRRDLAGIHTNSLGSAMVEFLKNSDTVSIFTSCLNSLQGKKSMPTDTELHTQLQVKEFYGMQEAYYYLERIEKYVNPAFSLPDPTIEHILPETMHTNSYPKQGVNADRVDDYNWEIDLGEEAKTIHDKYQHTLGNLTILPRSENSRMGDYRFNIKKNWQDAGNDGFRYGYLHTPIRISQSLRNYDVWNEEAILARCKEMVDHICNIWPHP